MIPMLLWVGLLASAGALAWRAMTQGGPWADWLWAAIGGISLAVFGGELLQAAPQLWEAIRTEDLWTPRPILQDHTMACAALVFFRPHRRKAAGPAGQ